MTLAFPEWLLTIENLTADWMFDTYEGEQADNDNPEPVYLLDDGFRFSWTFKDGLTPGVLEPSTLGFKLTCASAADMPSVHQGDQIILRLQRPPDVVSRDGSGVLVGAGVAGALDIVYEGFRVRDVAAAYDLGTKRVIVSVALTDYMADLNPSVDMTYGSPWWSKYDGNQNSWLAYGEPMSILGWMVPDHTTVSAYFRDWGLRKMGEADIRYGGDAASPRELQVLDAVYKWTQGQHHETQDGSGYDVATGWQGHNISVMIVAKVVGNAEMYPFSTAGTNWFINRSAKGNDESGLFFMAVWGPATTLDTAAFGLGLVGGLLSSVPSGVGLHENGDMLLLDAANIQAAPDWESSRVNAVNTWRFLGMSVDEGVDSAVEEFTVTDEDAIIRSGPISRTIETLLVANVYAGSGASGLNGLQPSANDYDNLRAIEANYRETIPKAAGDWSPSSFTLHPRSLTDAQWDAYCGRWYPTGRLQQSIAVVNLDADQNLGGADTPLFLTMTGCDIRLSRGHLFIEPQTRPIRLRILGTAAATVGDVKTSYPTITLADVAPGFTVGQARLTGP